jgi:guanylate kinase
MSSRGNLIVISAPSGSGKTSLAHRLLRETANLQFSVSHTTRRPRRGERDGVEYFFVSTTEFEQMIREEAFLEYAHVYGNYYGTSRIFVQSQLNSGNDVLLDIDVQGALKVREERPGALLIFVFPPSFQELRTRLKGRGLDDEAIISKRLTIAKDEIQYYRNYDYVIINKEIEDSLNEVKSIIVAARCSSEKGTEHAIAARCRVENRMERAEEVILTFQESS